MQNPVLKNAESGQIIELVKSPFSIGRALTSDYVIENKIVSRTHCSLIKTEEGWTLSDSSTNGTLVNDGHYKSETSPILKHNDEISLGYDSYTYRFLTEIEKAPNCQVERLKSQNSNIKGNTTFNEPSSPGTPNSFDENGISDDLLNDLADNMLNTVEQGKNESHTQVNNTVKNLEKPSTSKSNVTPHQTDDKDISEATARCMVTLGPPESNNIAFNQLNIEENDLGQAASTSDPNCDTCGQVEDNYKETNKQNNESYETAESVSNSSISTVIYSLPNEILPELSQPVSDNREEQASNMNVEPNKGTGTFPIDTGSIIAAATVENASTSTSKPRYLLAESIEAVVKNYSENKTITSTATASTSAQGARLVTCTSSNVITAPTSISLASPLNANKKIKVMTISTEVMNQLRPITGQPLTAYTIASGQQIRRITRDEMNIILAKQQGVPVVLLDKFPTMPSTVGTNSIGTQQRTGASIPTVSRNPKGGNTTVTSSTYGNTTSTSGSSPGRITILEGIRRSIHNTNLPLSTRNGLKRALRDYEWANPGASSTNAGSSVLASGNSLPQSIENQNNNTGISTTVSGNSLLQLAEHQNNTSCVSRIVSGNSFLQAAEGQNTGISTKNSMVRTTEDHTLTAGNPSTSSDVIDSLVVPAAVHEVVIEDTVEITDDVVGVASTGINQNMPAIKCNDYQEPGTSKASEKIVSDDTKQYIQNQYEEMENEMMCTICANLFIKAVTLGCSHSFCQYCIGEWKKKKIECPICRNKITSTIRTLVLDNIIEKMLETASKEDKEDRKVAIEERKKIEDEETAKKNKENADKNNGRGGRRGRRGGRGNANTRGNQRNNPGNETANNMAAPGPVITIADSPSTTDSDNSDSSNNSAYDYDDYYSDEWYNGQPGAYYGGYGRCYNCGERGHWSNGCPYRAQR